MAKTTATKTTKAAAKKNTAKKAPAKGKKVEKKVVEQNVAPVETEEVLEKVVNEAPAEKKKGGKPVDPNSGRQRIMQILRDSDSPLSPKEINDKLKEQGFEIKYISSHLNYFKAHGQVIHQEDKKYRIAEKMKELATA
mgnify:CR=1 FL=1